ncbi:MAG: Mrp/NBP35 family ATP-binding protein [Bacteroidales bacterium]|nr:Mrp/NBP35 family ATP-binding protein [Bacteroidales bacterium]
MAFYPKLVTDALRTVIHPEKKTDIVTLGMVEDDIRISGNRVSFSLLFDRPNDPLVATIKQMCADAIKRDLGPEVEIDGNIFIKIRQREQAQVPVLPNVKNVIAVASGKGGVGKSTVTANLAVALANAGCKVGLLDADIFGPSIPIMFGTESARPCLSPNSAAGRDLIAPVEKYGVRMLSIGYFVNPDEAVIWRGGMATNALRQLITEADWSELDYLLIDMPPGTSDIHITTVNTIDLTGAIIVSTPQRVALADAVKGIDMFRNEKVNVPIIGIVENMAWFTPRELPENKYFIFGEGGAKRLSEEMGVPLLAQIPIVQGIRENGDKGTPAALDENTMTGQAFAQLAQNVIEHTRK